MTILSNDNANLNARESRIAALERSHAELLAACKAIVRWLDEENNPDRTHAGCVALLTTAEDAARAAIAQAEKVVTT